MPHTTLLAKGNPADVDEIHSELVQLDVSAYRTIRFSVGNWVNSPSSVTIAISHVDQPNTPNANLISGIDSFPLAPGESASKVYDVPGEVVTFMAVPSQPAATGIKIDFTIYGRRK